MGLVTLSSQRYRYLTKKDSLPPWQRVEAAFQLGRPIVCSAAPCERSRPKKTHRYIEAAERITADPFSEISAGFLGEFWQTLGELGQDFGRIWEDLAGFRQDVGWIWEPRA